VSDPARACGRCPAGFVDAEEDPRAAAGRETREETGLEVEVGAVVDVYPTPGKGGASFFLAFEARVVGGRWRRRTTRWTRASSGRTSCRSWRSRAPARRRSGVVDRAVAGGTGRLEGMSPRACPPACSL
jgi:ADP-ribose pyrophosphatase YjhB (NUDIX family)